MELESIEWICPKCGFKNVVLIDLEYGPSGEDICSGCDAVFSLDELRKQNTI